MEDNRRRGTFLDGLLKFLGLHAALVGAAFLLFVVVMIIIVLFFDDQIGFGL